MKVRMIALLIFLSLFFIFNFSIAAEPDYPTKSIEMFVGFSPGAGTDLGARMIAEHAKKHLGQEVVVVNKPGGGGRVALTLVSKAKPDGYTLSATTDSAVILSPHLEKYPYKPLEDFTFISQFGLLEFGVVVLSDSPFRTFKDLMDFARANPDKLTISTVGVGTTNHVAFEALMLLEGLKIKLVPFSGAAPAMTALLGKHVMVASTAASGYATHMKAKTVRLLAVMSEERLDVYPDVPTLKELGYPLVFQSWYIISGPKNMEKSVVKKLADVFIKGTEPAEFIKLAKDLEIYTKNPLSGDELREGIVRRDKKNAELFKKLGMAIKQ